MSRVLVLLGLVFLAGCTPEVLDVTSAPATDVPSGYAYKVPGIWTVVVDDAALTKVVPLTARVCTGSDYPVDRPAFEKSVADTFRPLVEDIRVADADTVAPLKGTAGIIHVSGEALRISIREVPNFWEYGFEATLEIDAHLSVAGATGAPLTETMATGSARSAGGSGMLCEKAGAIFVNAAHNAIIDVLTPLAAKFANTRAIRDAGNAAP